MSGVFLKNHYGSKKNNSCIFHLSLNNCPYGTLLKMTTTVSLPPRSPDSIAGRVTLLYAPEEVSLSGRCVNTVMQQESTVRRGKPLKVFKASKAKLTYILFLCYTWRLCLSQKENILSGVLTDQNAYGRLWQKTSWT